jgi:hypothetical protein
MLYCPKFPPWRAADVDGFCLIFDIISNMAGVGLFNDLSAVRCQEFVGSGTRSELSQILVGAHRPLFHVSLPAFWDWQA